MVLRGVRLAPRALQHVQRHRHDSRSTAGMVTFWDRPNAARVAATACIGSRRTGGTCFTPAALSADERRRRALHGGSKRTIHTGGQDGTGNPACFAARPQRTEIICPLLLNARIVAEGSNLASGCVPAHINALWLPRLIRPPFTAPARCGPHQSAGCARPERTRSPCPRASAQ
jgi:hypothetical protein